MSPRVQHGIPEGSIQDSRVRQVDQQVYRAGRFAAEQHMLPRFAAIGRAIDAAFAVRAEAMPQRSHVHHVRVVWMDADTRDAMRFRESDVLPALPAID